MGEVQGRWHLGGVGHIFAILAHLERNYIWAIQERVTAIFASVVSGAASPACCY